MDDTVGQLDSARSCGLMALGTTAIVTPPPTETGSFSLGELHNLMTDKPCPVPHSTHTA
jgi:hypothetical protein